MEAAALAVAAGALTTLTGLGGGHLLLLSLSALWDPLLALTVTAPALLVGNLHRLALFRASVDWRVALGVAAGALPGSVVGGLLATRLPPRLLFGLMAVVTAIAVARAAGRWRLTVPRALLVPAGAVAGVVTAGGGGMGLLVAPLLVSAGLAGDRYVGTAAVCAVSAHVGRLSAYSASGLVDARTLLWASGLAVAITVGNTLGRALRTRLAEGMKRRVELAALVVAAGLAVAGAT